MTGRRYYITTLADWHRHAHRFANSHWLAVGVADRAVASREVADASSAMPDVGADALAHDAQLSATTRIIVLVDADEGVHLTLDDDGTFEALPPTRSANAPPIAPPPPMTPPPPPNSPRNSAANRRSRSQVRRRKIKLHSPINARRIS